MDPTDPVEPPIPVEGVAVDEVHEGRATVAPPLRWGFAIVLALALGLTRNGTLVATVLVVIGGVAILGVGRLLPPPRRLVLEKITLGAALIWGTLFVAFNIWELGTFLLGDNEHHPTFSALTAPALAWFPIRTLAALLWLAVGWRALER
jgi:hypothetical protein